MRYAILVTIVAGGLVFTGCSSPAPKPTSTPGPTTSAVRQVLNFGEERPGRRGTIVVSKPAGHDLPADPQRAKELTRGAKFDVKVRNTTEKALPAAQFTFTATVNGAAATVLSDPAKNIGDKLPSDVLPGMERAFAIVAPLPAKPAEVTIKVTFERANPMYWTGTV